MNASTVTATGQATTNPPAPVEHLLLTDASQIKETYSPDNMSADKIALRAAQITVVLRDILEQPGYRHGGLNE